MSSSTNKRVLIQRFERENLYGYVNPAAYLQPAGVELLNLSGNLLVIPYPDIKAVCFVKEFEAPDPGEKRLFTSRPKSAGLWVRMRFKDTDQMDGLLANNLLAVDGYGYAVTPPDPSSNIQRVFVPRAALTEIKVQAVVGVADRASKTKVKPVPDGQIPLFE